jgi:repressor LexA
MLTRKQLDLLNFIHRRVQLEGVPPSFDEMKEALNLRSKSGIHRLITALEERGFIRRLAHRARAIEIVKLPDAMIKSTGFTPRVIEGDKSDPPRAAMPVEAVHATELPLMGRIAAGLPIEAIADGSQNIAVPGTMLQGSGNHYALEVKGDSMIEAGINDGDLVLIKQQSTADNGDMVVALVDDDATIKEFYHKGDMIILKPKSSDKKHQPIILTSDFRIQGIVTAVIPY